MTQSRHPLAVILAAVAVLTLWLPTLAAPARAAAPVTLATLA